MNLLNLRSGISEASESGLEIIPGPRTEKSDTFFAHLRCKCRYDIGHECFQGLNQKEIPRLNSLSPFILTIISCLTIEK